MIDAYASLHKPSAKILFYLPFFIMKHAILNKKY